MLGRMAAKRKAKATAKRKPVKRKDRPKPRPSTAPKAHRARPGSLRPQGKMTAAVKKAIVASIAKDWNVIGACHAANISVECYRVHRRDDPEFAAAIDAAHETYTQTLRDEIHRRGVEGVDKPVFFKGSIVGYVREYSDSLLTLHARRHDKAYVESVQVKQETKLTGSLVSLKAGLAELAPEVRSQLQSLVKAQLAAKAEAAKDD